MKGSLVINQTMIIILAVIALAIIMALWFTIGGSGSSELSNRMQLEKLCNAYASEYPECEEYSDDAAKNVLSVCRRIPGLENVPDDEIDKCCRIACG